MRVLFLMVLCSTSFLLCGQTIGPPPPPPKGCNLSDSVSRFEFSYREFLKDVGRIELIAFDDVLAEELIEQVVFEGYTESDREVDSTYWPTTLVRRAMLDLPYTLRTQLYLDTGRIIERVELDTALWVALGRPMYGFESDIFESVFCDNPRHGILFFDLDGEIDAYIEICFECQRTSSVNVVTPFIHCSEQNAAIREFFREAGITKRLDEGY